MSEQAGTVTRDARATAPNIYPRLGYRDAKAAIRWLCEAFGFEQRMVLPGEDREVAHAELSLGPGSSCSARPAPTWPPSTPTPSPPFALYVAVEDVDAHAERGRAAGAEMFAS